MKIDINFNKNEDGNKLKLSEVKRFVGKIEKGGGEKAMEKIKEKGRLTPRERVNYLIDKNHSNSYTAWLAMGSPQKPTREQINSLEKASQLTEVNLNIQFQKQNDKLSAELLLARQGVMLLELDF